MIYISSSQLADGQLPDPSGDDCVGTCSHFEWNRTAVALPQLGFRQLADVSNGMSPARGRGRTDRDRPGRTGALEPPQASAGRQHSSLDGGRAYRGVCRLSGATQPYQRSLQGWAALPSQRRSRRSRGAGHVDVLEMRHHEPPLRRSQGWHRLRPRRSDQWRAGAIDAPLHRRGACRHRPAHGRHGTRSGNRRANHGLDHGHL